MPPPSGNPPRRRPASTGGAPAARPATGSVPRRAATGVSPSVKTRKVAPSAKLVCQAGPATGQEFVLEGDELSIGRAAENPVSIPDTSVSRKHALIRKTPGGWAISDLGSGHGTLLNGEAVADETDLSEGDVISLGDTELCFSRSGAVAESSATDDDAAPPRRAPVRTARAGGGAPIERSNTRGRPVRTARTADDPQAARQKRSKIFVRVGGVMVVVLALMVGWKAVDNKRRKQAEIAAAGEEAHHGEMADMFKEAKTLVRQGRWTEAKARLKEIQETDPDFEPKQISNYLTIADQEIPNQAALEQANAAVKAGQLAQAASFIKKIKSTAQSETPLRSTRDALDAKITEKLSEARGLVSARDLTSQEKLKGIAEDILAAREDDRDATELKKQADAAIYAIKNPTIAPPPPETPWLEVQQRFKTGDSSGALSLAQACANKQPKCRELEAQIKEWDVKSKRVEELSESDLIVLFELDRRVAGGTSSEQSRPIRTQLVSKLFVKASQLKTTGNWSRAIEYARKVLQADPSHAGAQSLVNEARNQAKDVYLRGYQLKESDPTEAIRLFKDVMNMTPSDDELYGKAKSRVAELQKQ